MKTKITLIALSVFWLVTEGLAQSTCANDRNGFVNYKNVGSTGSYQLNLAFEEKASQTYNYSGPGKVDGVRVFGNYPVAGLGGVPLRIGIYNVDASGKPTTSLATANHTWWGFIDNSNGYIDVTFPNGVTVNSRFAVTVEIRNNVFPYGSVFDLRYTGNGEGGAQDLACLAGNSTGYNWASAKNSFGKDGDFYLVPTMTHSNVPTFSTSSSCYAINSSISFVNNSQFTKDSMFNRISLTNYSGSNYLYTWNFGDGSAVSHAQNPSHTYTTGGVFTTTLTTTIEGWTASPCVRTFTRSVSVGLNVSASAISSASCNGASTGSFTANGQFGAPGYSFSINNGSTWQTSGNFSGLSAGNYTVLIKDTKSCTNSTNLSITQPAGIVFNSIITSNATCGNATGGIVASASGGISPLQYKINNGALQASGTFSALLAQTYTLGVVDGNSCATNTLVIVNDLGGPTMGNPNITNVSCAGGNDGSITLTSSGGTGLIQYSINGGTTYQTSGVFSNVSSGTFVCVVKDNAGCTDIVNVVIGQGQAIGLTVSATAASCNGSSDGVIYAVSNGGTGIHNYSINGVNYQSGTSFTGLLAGTYTVYAKDVTSCVKTATVVVSQPSAIIVALSSGAASCNASSNGSIAAVGSGGVGNYIYSINGIDYQTSGSFLNLPAGSYTVNMKDGNNCTTSSAIAVSQPAAITTTINTSNSTCNNANGSILVLAGGGSGSGYQYSINGGVNFFTSGLFSTQAAGTKYIVVKDGSGCQIIVSGTIVDSNGPTITGSSQQNVACNGGSDGNITITGVTGGSGALQYSKNGINWQTSSVFTGLSAGVYLIQVKDANGCIGTTTKTLTQPNGFLITSATASVACHGAATGACTITASGGAGFLSYSINDGSSYQSGSIFNGLMGGVYTVMVKDAAGCTGGHTLVIQEPSEITFSSIGLLNVTCNGANDGAIYVSTTGGFSPYQYSINFGPYSSANSFNNLSGNSFHLVSVKDANNCVVSTSIFLSEPTALSVASIINNIKCAGGNNGAINLNVTGGVAPYTYQWSNGSNIQSIFNLYAGIYSVLVTDYNGCTSSNTYTLSQPSNPLVTNGVIVNASSTNSGDGSIDVTISGGAAPYTFIWSNGSTTEDISNLNPGTYVISITDANGCTTSSSFIVENITGLASIQINSGEVKVYPNPANENITVEAKGYRIDKVELINLIGQLVYSSEVNDSVARISASEIPNGTYFVKVYVNNTTVAKRITINK